MTSGSKEAPGVPEAMTDRGAGFGLPQRFHAERALSCSSASARSTWLASNSPGSSQFARPPFDDLDPEFAFESGDAFATRPV